MSAAPDLSSSVLGGALPVRILFVCLGNICRSPSAEAVMRALVREQGLQDLIEVDSAGTGDWHVGQRPDPRAAAAAARRGISLDGVARQVEVADFETFHLILAMDESNAIALEEIAPDAAAAAKVRLLREFERGGSEVRQARSRPAADLDVPDPYHGGESGFECVLDLIEGACAGVLRELERAIGRR